MSFFSNFFGNNSNTLTTEVEPAFDKALFVDDSEPGHTEPIQKVTYLDQLLKKDYRSEGLVHGYEEHCADIMELHMNSIVSEFQQAMRSEIDELETAMEGMNEFLAKEYSDLMPSHYLKLRSRYDTLNLKKVEFNAEIELAVDRKGICLHALNTYREGFIKGLKAWSEETHFNA